MTTKEEYLKKAAERYEAEQKQLWEQTEMEQTCGFKMEYFSKGLFYVCEVKTLDDVRHIVKTLTAVNETHTQNYTQVINSPYSVGISNNRPGGYKPGSRLNVSYQTKYGQLNISCPVSTEWGFVRKYDGYLTAIERDSLYKPGVTMSQLKSVRIPSYQFTGEQIKYSGRWNVCIDTDMIKKILE